ncbi:MAG: hypothetical protein MJ207_04160 [Bacilli bacterium]|nr:hypothetical protein [Bacilli bacterium]
MQNAKKGLKLMTISIIVMMVYTVAYSILLSIAVSADELTKLLNTIFEIFWTYGILGAAVVQVITFAIAMIGLKIAGRDNERFLKARKAKIFSLILAFVGVVAGIACVVGSIIGNSGKASDIIQYVVVGGYLLSAVSNILLVITEIIVFRSIAKGCREIAPTVGGISTAAFVSYILSLIFNIVLPIFPILLGIGENYDLMQKLISVVGYLESVASTAYSVLYIVLIFVTTHNIKKKEEPRMRTKLPR